MPAFRRGSPGKTWQKRRPPSSPRSIRDDEQYAKDSARMAHIVAGMFCPSCGVTVREDGLHSRDCIDVPRERRRAK